MKEIKKILKYIGNVLALLSVVFVLYTISQMKVNISNIQNWNKITVIGIVGCFICVISIGLLALAWKRILEYLSGEEIEYRTAYKIYAKANLGKYIPGNVMHYVERNVFAGQIGLGQAEVALTSGLEIIGLIIAAFILSIILSAEKLISITKEIMTIKYVVVIIIVVLLIIVGVYLCKKKNQS